MSDLLSLLILAVIGALAYHLSNHPWSRWLRDLWRKLTTRLRRPDVASSDGRVSEVQTDDESSDVEDTEKTSRTHAADGKRHSTDALGRKSTTTQAGVASSSSRKGQSDDDVKATKGGLPSRSEPDSPSSQAAKEPGQSSPAAGLEEPEDGSRPATQGGSKQQEASDAVSQARNIRQKKRQDEMARYSGPSADGDDADDAQSEKKWPWSWGIWDHPRYFSRRSSDEDDEDGPSQQAIPVQDDAAGVRSKRERDSELKEKTTDSWWMPSSNVGQGFVGSGNHRAATDDSKKDTDHAPSAWDTITGGFRSRKKGKAADHKNDGQPIQGHDDDVAPAQARVLDQWADVTPAPQAMKPQKDKAARKEERRARRLAARRTTDAPRDDERLDADDRVRRERRLLDSYGDDDRVGREADAFDTVRDRSKRSARTVQGRRDRAGASGQRDQVDAFNDVSRRRRARPTELEDDSKEDFHEPAPRRTRKVPSKGSRARARPALKQHSRAKAPRRAAARAYDDDDDDDTMDDEPETSTNRQRKASKAAKASKPGKKGLFSRSKKESSKEKEKRRRAEQVDDDRETAKSATNGMPNIQIAVGGQSLGGFNDVGRPSAKEEATATKHDDATSSAAQSAAVNAAPARLAPTTRKVALSDGDLDRLERRKRLQQIKERRTAKESDLSAPTSVVPYASKTVDESTKSQHGLKIPTDTDPTFTFADVGKTRERVVEEPSRSLRSTTGFSKIDKEKARHEEHADGRHEDLRVSEPTFITSRPAPTVIVTPESFDAAPDRRSVDSDEWRTRQREVVSRPDYRQETWAQPPSIEPPAVRHVHADQEQSEPASRPASISSETAKRVDAEINAPRPRYVRMAGDVDDLPRYAENSRPPIYPQGEREAGKSSILSEPLVFLDVGPTREKVGQDDDSHDRTEEPTGQSSRERHSLSKMASPALIEREPQENVHMPSANDGPLKKRQFVMSDVGKAARADVETLIEPEQEGRRSSVDKPRYHLETKNDNSSNMSKSTDLDLGTDEKSGSKEKSRDTPAIDTGRDLSIDEKRSSIAKPPIAILTDSRTASEPDDYLAGIADEILGMPSRQVTSDKLKQEAARQAKWDVIRPPEPALHAPLAVYRLDDMQYGPLPDLDSKAAMIPALGDNKYGDFASVAMPEPKPSATPPTRADDKTAPAEAKAKAPTKPPSWPWKSALFCVLLTAYLYGTWSLFEVQKTPLKKTALQAADNRSPGLVTRATPQSQPMLFSLIVRGYHVASILVLGLLLSRIQHDEWSLLGMWSKVPLSVPVQAGKQSKAGWKRMRRFRRYTWIRLLVIVVHVGAAFLVARQITSIAFVRAGRGQPWSSLPDVTMTYAVYEAAVPAWPDAAGSGLVLWCRWIWFAQVGAFAYAASRVRWPGTRYQLRKASHSVV